MKLLTYLFLPLITLFFISCGENTQETQIPDIVSIQINPHNIQTYSTDAPLALSATVTYSDSTTADVTSNVNWSSSNNDVVNAIYGNLTAGIVNGGDANLSITYDKFSDTTSVVVHKLTSYTIKHPDINSTGSYIFEALGNFDNNETNRTIVTNINWYADNNATIEVASDGKATITLQTGDTNVTVTMFNDTNTSSPIAPQTVPFTIN
jgi:hypothetical protein